MNIILNAMPTRLGNVESIYHLTEDNELKIPPGKDVTERISSVTVFADCGFPLYYTE